jgi:hypothetical protein
MKLSEWLKPEGKEREKWLTGVSGLELKFNLKFQILNLI